MKKILFFIFLILPTFANSFDEHYKFDHWAYERIMFGKTESREEAKKLLESYKLNNLEVRDTNKPYLGPIIDGHSHPSCLLYTSPSPRDGLLSRMPSSA